MEPSRILEATREQASSVCLVSQHAVVHKVGARPSSMTESDVKGRFKIGPEF